MDLNFVSRQNYRQSGIYGPPPFCKRGMRKTGWFARMYSAAVKNEFNDGFAKLASDLGSTITNEIQQEHPEYLNTSDKDSQGK
jgi:hypothetical protein